MTLSNFISAEIYYYEPPADGSKPIFYVNPDSARKANFGSKPYKVQIENVRGREKEFTLDQNGFAFIHAPAQHKAFSSDEGIESEYYPEVVEHIKKATGASRVVIFDHTLRRRIEGADDKVGQRQPALRAHVDQSYEATVKRIYRHLPDEADELVKKRFQILNLWRPINAPAFDHPLGVTDWKSIDPVNEVVPTILRYPDRDGETLSVAYSPEHKWKYVRGLTPDEAILIKCGESIRDGSVAQFTAHTAFKDPTTPEDAPPRESIEVRTLVFYD